MGPRPPPPGMQRVMNSASSSVSSGTAVPVAVWCIVPMRGAVAGVHVDRHAHPAVVHAERQEHLVAHVVLEAPTVDAAHDLGEQRHARGEVVAGALARHPVLLGLDAADRLDHLVPVGVARRVAVQEVGAADARGVGEQVAQRDRVLARLRELGDVLGDRVVELEGAALPLLGDRDRDRGLGHREPGDQRLGSHGHAGARLAGAEVGHRRRPRSDT